jgi:sugar lactone lactonase YvrE
VQLGKSVEQRRQQPTGRRPVEAHGDRFGAGGYEGTVHVYELASRSLVARFDVGRRPSCVNDLAFGPGGETYVTDSLVPVLFRVAGDPLAIESWVDLADQAVPWADGLNLNGIVQTRDHRHLVACQTNLGRFWQIALDTGAVSEVALDGGPLEHCDGLALSETTLYVAVNARNQLAVVRLSDDGATGRVSELLLSERSLFRPRWPSAMIACSSSTDSSTGWARRRACRSRW